MSLSNETHGIGRFFWHTISLKKKSPLVHRYPTHEVDAPYRWSNSLILRLPGTTGGLVLGWWHRTIRTEEQALLAAMAGRDMDFHDLHDEQKSNIRRRMIKEQVSAEHQLLIAEALEL